MVAREDANGTVAVVFMDPEVVLQLVDIPEIHALGTEVRALLQEVCSSISAQHLAHIGIHPENNMKTLYWILWPAFLVAVLATAFLIAAIDRQIIDLAAYPITLSTLGAYTLCFVVVWALAAASSLTTCILQRNGDDINRTLCHLTG